jgi:hypothetical protein
VAVETPASRATSKSVQAGELADLVSRALFALSHLLKET